LCPFVAKQTDFFYFGERSKKSDEKSAKVKQKAVSLQRKVKNALLGVRLL
jgi:hypothetical protein